MKEDELKKIVRDAYSNLAGSSCCPPGFCNTDVCGTEYGDENAPEEANLGLGCGNPVSFADLKEGEFVLDLGSGAGYDCFLAAGKVGKNGKVIGVDMTPEMVEKAHNIAAKGNYSNVEFKLADMEDLPVDDESVDAVISNCAINLVPDKQKVFNETYRVLKKGGRIVVSDIVANGELPDYIKNDLALYVGCVSGAAKKEEYLRMIENAGFKDIEILEERLYPVGFGCGCGCDLPTISSVIVRGYKE